MIRLFFLLLSLSLLGSARADSRPNFILLLSDDQDWTGLSMAMHPDVPGSKSTIYETPYLEKFAAEGMRFSAAYAPSPVCSPTRISLQTGRNPAALHWTKAAPPERGYPLIEGETRRSISDEEVTIAEVLREAGYATAHFGKWHLVGGGPERHGYDVSDGNTGNGDAAPFKGDNPVDIFGMGRRAVAFMKESQASGKPFYVQMSYHALHYPQNASPESVAYFKEKAAERNIREHEKAAITRDLDIGVGQLLKEMDGLGLQENTYVIYMSDNGGGGGGGKRSGGRPVQGGKGSAWEGGIRVPLIIRGPGIAANSWCHERVVGFDLFPTFCRLAGIKTGLPKDLEGGDISHLLRGESGVVQRPREELVFHFPHYQGDSPHSAILLGDYKAIHFYETGETRLFDLSEDLGETRNLAKIKPEHAAALEARLKAYLSEVDAELPKPNPDYDPANPPAQRPKGEKKPKEPRGEGGKPRAAG